MWTRWLPWRFVITRVARAHGFLDPIPLLARLRHFAEPSEVAEPMELLRAGAVFHSRGLINSRVIQYNLDWLWPYWVAQQYDPHSKAFLPRAFSLTHVNLTHRNWTAVGLPDCELYAVVDPRGMVTPHLDGWSVDAGIVCDDGRSLWPSQAGQARQSLDCAQGLSIVTETGECGLSLTLETSTVMENGIPECRIQCRAQSDSDGWLMLLLRPCNPEGISFVHHLQLSTDRLHWLVNDTDKLILTVAPEKHVVGNYAAGDAANLAAKDREQTYTQCDVGLANAAAMYRLQRNSARDIAVRIPLLATTRNAPAPDAPGNGPQAWSNAMQNSCRLKIADPHYQHLYDAALRTLILLSPKDIYPGPYTYKRFWFRDAVLMVHALLCAGLTARATRCIEQFLPRQTLDGFFHSQQGEWDSNGQVLWLMARHHQFTRQPLGAQWMQALIRGAHWIGRKRRVNPPGGLESGLLPAGFSAEHLGLNNFYYWDNFWGVAGLQSATELCRWHGRPELAEEFAREAGDYLETVEHSLAIAAVRLGRPAMPAAPNRRLDAGVIGSLAAGYPAQLFGAHDPRLLDSVEYLLSHSFYDGGFFQDMVHSGINAYLTLQVAQVLLRAGDPRWLDLMDTVASLASATGQWPEAIHPHTRGGCMGDGQHGWAAAEWIMMLRACLVRESGDRLVLCSGLKRDWLAPGVPVEFGPAPTPFGALSLSLSLEATDTSAVPLPITIRWQGNWFSAAPGIDICLPGEPTVQVPPGQFCVRVVWAAGADPTTLRANGMSGE